MTTTADHAGGRPDDWAAPGAALVRSAATDTVPPLAELGRVHIMGIAGAGMSGLARILLERGVPVSGCEARESLGVAALRALGADVRIGHSVEHLSDADTFVYTTAINPQQEEFVAARESGMPVLRRAAALAAGLEGLRCIAIAGTHGKTTTTSLLTVGAQACGVDPSFAIGGNLYETGRNAHLGSGDLAIVEADESDGSFLLTRPALAAVTNVEADHLENHGDLEGIFRAFELFVDRIDQDGLLITCAGRPGCPPHRGPRPPHRPPGAHVRREPGRGRRGERDQRARRRGRVHGHRARPDAAPRSRRLAHRRAHGPQRDRRARARGRARAGPGHRVRILGAVRRRAPAVRVARRRRRGAHLRRLRAPPDRDRGVPERGEGRAAAAASD